MSDGEDFSLGSSLKKKVRLPIALTMQMDYDVIALSAVAGISKAMMIRVLVGEAIEARKKAGTFPEVASQGSPQPDATPPSKEEVAPMIRSIAPVGSREAEPEDENVYLEGSYEAEDIDREVVGEDGARRDPAPLVTEPSF